MRKRLMMLPVVAIMAAIAAFAEAVDTAGLYGGAVSGYLVKDAFPENPAVYATCERMYLHNDDELFPNNTTWVYWGYMYLSGTTYFQKRHWDDYVLIKVNDEVMVDDVGYNTYAGKAFTAAEPGWYKFEIRGSQGDGGVGADEASQHGVYWWKNRLAVGGEGEISDLDWEARRKFGNFDAEGSVLFRTAIPDNLLHVGGNLEAEASPAFGDYALDSALGAGGRLELSASVNGGHDGGIDASLVGYAVYGTRADGSRTLIKSGNEAAFTLTAEECTGYAFVDCQWNYGTIVCYVAPGGTGSGSSWEDPVGSIADAWTAIKTRLEQINLLTDRVVVKMKEGVYPFTAGSEVSGYSGSLMIRGGYAGVGDERGGETLIARTSDEIESNFIAVKSFGSSVFSTGLVFDTLTFSNAFSKASIYGQAIAAVDSVVTVRNCLFVKNGRNNSLPNDTSTVFYGGAVGAYNSIITIEDSCFDDNALRGDSNSICGTGGAIGAVGSIVKISRSTFSRNHMQTQTTSGRGGGALAFWDCPSVVVDHCLFESNFVYVGSSSSGGYSTPSIYEGPYGGVIYQYKNTATTISDCTIRGGWISSRDPSQPLWGWGGVIYSSGGSTLDIYRTRIVGTGKCDDWYEAAPGYCGGSIDLYDGRLYMENVLFADTYQGWCVGNNYEAVINAVNCTFVGNRGEGDSSLPSAVFVQNGTNGGITLKNCIVWNNAGGVWHAGNNGPALAATYCDLEGAEPDAGSRIICADPRFIDAASGDYRLLGSSPCVNAGDGTDFAANALDLDGCARISGDAIDLGCFERQIRSGFMLIIR